MPLDAGEQPRGEQRVAAELKEILLRADRPHAKQLLPELCEDGFNVTLRTGAVNRSVRASMLRYLPGGMQ